MAHRVVNLGIRAVHRAIDTGGAGESGGHAEAGENANQKRGAGMPLWATGVVSACSRMSVGAGVRARFRTAVSGMSCRSSENDHCLCDGTLYYRCRTKQVILKINIFVQHTVHISAQQHSGFCSSPVTLAP